MACLLNCSWYLQGDFLCASRSCSALKVHLADESLRRHRPWFVLALPSPFAPLTSLLSIPVVAFDESVKSATRISSLYSFTSVLTGLALGILVRFVRRLKPFMIVGIVFYIVAFGLLIRYRGTSMSDHAGLIGGQVVLGFA